MQSPEIKITSSQGDLRTFEPGINNTGRVNAKEGAKEKGPDQERSEPFRVWERMPKRREDICAQLRLCASAKRVTGV